MPDDKWIYEDLQDEYWFQLQLLSTSEPVHLVGPMIWGDTPKEDDDGRTSPDES